MTAPRGTHGTDRPSEAPLRAEQDSRAPASAPTPQTPPDGPRGATDVEWFTLAHWCALLHHHCDGLTGDCRCDCHRNRTTLRPVH